MIIPFDSMELQILQNFKGGEGAMLAKMYVDDNNRILSATLAPGSSIGLHTHDTGSEIIYILKGNGTVLFDDGKESVSAGMCHYCPKGHTHSLINTGSEDLVFFAVVPEHP